VLKIKRKGTFNTQYRNLTQESPESIGVIDSQVRLFAKNPKDTRVKNHLLKRKLKGKWAFSITDDIRIVYEWQAKNTVRFLRIGPHTTAYKDKGLQSKT